MLHCRLVTKVQCSELEADNETAALEPDDRTAGVQAKDKEPGEPGGKVCLSTDMR